MWRSEDNLVGVHSFTVWVLGIELSQEHSLFPLGPLTSHSFICLVLEKKKGEERGRKKMKMMMKVIYSRPGFWR